METTQPNPITALSRSDDNYAYALQTLINRHFRYSRLLEAGIQLRRVNSLVTVEVRISKDRTIIQPAEGCSIFMDEPFIAELLQSGRFEMTMIGDKCLLASI